MSKILITGTAGFIGFHLANVLTAKGHFIVGIDSINDYYDINLKYARLKEAGIEKKDVAWNIEVNSLVHSNYLFVRMELENKEAMIKLFEKYQFDVVINLAAQAGVRYSLENPDAYIQSNIVGFLNVLECCRHYDVKHLLYASSSSVYGENKKVPFSEKDSVDRPISLYAATKKSNELMAYTYSYLYKIQTTGLRFFTVYGPWGRPDMAPMLFASAIYSDKPIKVFNDGDMLRDFTYVDDIVDGVVKCLNFETNKVPKAEIFNIGNSKPINLMGFIETLEKAIGKKAKKIMLPMQPGDVKVTYADTTKLQKEIEYKLKTEIKQGVDNFIKWFMQYYNNSFQ